MLIGTQICMVSAIVVLSRLHYGPKWARRWPMLSARVLRAMWCGYFGGCALSLILWLGRFNFVDPRSTSAIGLAHYYAAQGVKELAEIFLDCPTYHGLNLDSQDPGELNVEELVLYVLNARPPSEFSPILRNQHAIREANLALKLKHSKRHHLPHITLRVVSTAHNAHNGTDILLRQVSVLGPSHWCLDRIRSEMRLQAVFEHRLFWQYLDLFRQLLQLHPQREYFFVLEDDVLLLNVTALATEYAFVTGRLKPQVYSFFIGDPLGRPNSCFYDSGTCGFVIRKDVVQLILELADNGSFNRCDLPPIDLFLAQFVSYRTRKLLIEHPHFPRFLKDIEATVSKSIILG